MAAYGSWRPNKPRVNRRMLQNGGEFNVISNPFSLPRIGLTKRHGITISPCMENGAATELRQSAYSHVGVNGEAAFLLFVHLDHPARDRWAFWCKDGALLHLDTEPAVRHPHNQCSSFVTANSPLSSASEGGEAQSYRITNCWCANRGKTRLAKWYAPYNDEEKIKLKGEVCAMSTYATHSNFTQSPIPLKLSVSGLSYAYIIIGPSVGRSARPEIPIQLR